MAVDRLTRALCIAAILIPTVAVPAFGKASHEGWPEIDGVLKMHTYYGDGSMVGHRAQRRAAGWPWG